MTSLVVDVGNTFLKAALFQQDDMVWTGKFEADDISELRNLPDRHRIDRAIISSVKKHATNWPDILGDNVVVKYFNVSMAVGITNHYRTPHTLGLDRLAAVMGAYYAYPAAQSLVIDAGTCIKYDSVDSKGNYLGGSISPGLNMRYSALNHYTDALPLVEPHSGFYAAYGDDTASAIISGVQNGIKHELNGFIESYFDKQPQVNVILTGGDGFFFDTLLKNSIFAPYIKIEPYLVFKGLNAAIQRHND